MRSAVASGPRNVVVPGVLVYAGGTTCGLAPGVQVGVALGVDVAVAVAVAVAVGVAVGVGLGVPIGQGPASETTRLSTLQPVREAVVSEHMRQRSFTIWPMPAAGRFTVVVTKPAEEPLQFGLSPPYCCMQGFVKPVLMAMRL